MALPESPDSNKQVFLNPDWKKRNQNINKTTRFVPCRKKIIIIKKTRTKTKTKRQKLVIFHETEDLTSNHEWNGIL